MNTCRKYVSVSGEMRHEDYMTIVSFATNITVWDDMDTNIVQATPGNITTAISYVQSLQAAGETNINDALLQAMQILSDVRETGLLKASFVYLFRFG